MILLCVKQHLKHSNTEAKLKKVLLIKTACILNTTRKRIFDEPYELVRYKNTRKGSYLHKPEAAFRGVL